MSDILALSIGILYFLNFGMSELDGRRCIHVSHMQRGVQKLEDGPFVGLGTQDVKITFGVLVNFICSFTPDRNNQDTLNRLP